MSDSSTPDIENMSAGELEGEIRQMNVMPTRKTMAKLKPGRSDVLKLKAKVLGTKHEIMGLVDSGATSCFISNDLIQKIGLEDRVQEVKPITIRVAVYDSITETNKAIQLPLEMDFGKIKLEISIMAYVVPDIRQEFYLGMPFMTAYAKWIDWSTASGETDSAEEQEFDQEEERIEALFNLQLEPELDKGEEKIETLFNLQHEQEVDKEKDRIETLFDLQQEPDVPEINIINGEALLDAAKTPSNHIGLLHVIKEEHERRQPSLTTGIPSLSPQIKLIEGMVPTYRTQYGLTQAEKLELEHQVSDLVTKDVITEFESPILFAKMHTGEIQLCMEFPALQAPLEELRRSQSRQCYQRQTELSLKPGDQVRVRGA